MSLLDRLAQRRRPFDQLEHKLVQLSLKHPDADSQALVNSLRYVISFGRLTGVRNADGEDIDLLGPMDLHARKIKDLLTPVFGRSPSLWDASAVLPEAIASTRRARTSILQHLPVDPDSLEHEVCNRLLAVASGGGGGAGYIYPGCYELLERSGLVPDVMAGTSIGALMSLFRCRRKTYDFAPLIAAARKLSWTGVFRVLETENRYGVPATLRLYLRAALGNLVQRQDGVAMRMSDMEIPLYIVATGITGDALKHDMTHYENLIDRGQRRSFRGKLANRLIAVRTISEFLASPENLIEVVIGNTPGTQDFDALDAAGFSAAVPGVIHYDVLREDPRMKRLLDSLYSRFGITRLGEGGLVSNVPTKCLWHSVTRGDLGHRNVFVLGLDCFAPNPRRLGWFPLQQIVRSANVERDKAYADLYVPFYKTLSPMNLVPEVHDALTAMRWGREAMRPHMPFVRAMCSPIRRLPNEQVLG